jgi:hypothetical protein
MTIITVEKLDAVNASVDKLIDQGKMLFGDITETVQDRARLLKHVEYLERTVIEERDRIAEMQERIDTLQATVDSVRATVDIGKPNGGVPTSILTTDGPVRRETLNLTELRRPAGSQGMLPRGEP